jgi:hypothetical protein
VSKFEHGLVTIADPGSDIPYLEQATTQCKHCGGHFPLRPGSKTIRGFCQRCNGFVCGPGCGECVPTEQLLENIEKGRELTFRPIMAPVIWTPRGDSGESKAEMTHGRIG